VRIRQLGNEQHRDPRHFIERGAGTTGIYIDDTPIQIRALAFNRTTTLPKSFDMDRIEVLRGPAGHLFGAGSEGGTVR